MRNLTGKMGKGYDQVIHRGFPGSSDGKKSTAMQETPVQSLGQEDPLEKGMATHSSILAWRIPWTEESGELIYGVTKSRTGLSN